MIRYWLRPFSYLYGQAGKLRNALYDRGWQKVVRLNKPVISIGNLTVGGTGKTPLTDIVIRRMQQKGKKVAVISRAYRAQAKDPVRVQPQQPQAAFIYGDEPVLLAQRNPTVSVYVGARKWEVALYAQSQGEYDVFIVDDGYQHRRLYRDLNIVILDATEKPENYAVLPEGRAREIWQGLQRSELIFLSKCNLADEGDLIWLEKNIPEGIRCLRVGYSISAIENAKGERIARAQLQQAEVFLVSAIARPDVFEAMVRDFARVSKASLAYRDHHQYSEEDLKFILESFKRSGAQYLVTTQKDAVKLLPLLKGSVPLWVAPLEVDMMNAERGLDEALEQIFG